MSSHSLTRPQLSIKNLTSPLLTGNYSDLVCSAVYRSETSGLSLEAHQSSIIQLDHMHHDRNARQTQPSQRKPTTRLLEPSSSLPAPHETKENTALHTLQRNQDIFGSKYRGPTTVARTHTTRAARLSGFASSVDGDMPRDTKSKAGKCDPTLLFRKRGIQEHTCVLDDYPSVWILISDNSVAFPQYVCKRQEIFA